MKKIYLKIGAVVILMVALISYLNSSGNKDKVLVIKEVKDSEEKRAMFLSYIEYYSYLNGKTDIVMKETLQKILDTLKENNFNMLIVQVRSHSDAIYNSALFPSSMTIVKREGDELPFDVLSFIVEEAHKRKIEVHAWVNPYRIRSKTDGSSISIKNPCYKWLGSRNVQLIEGKGIYYNPASEEVRKLIFAGIEEILENYPIDGILFDDYFYPDDTIDSEEYKIYVEEGGTLSRNDYRLEQVNELVRGTYFIVNSYGKVFGISPEGNIENNYKSNYADTKKWMSNKGYIDYIMPQIYFGFQNERKPFYETVKEWNSFITEPTVDLLPALAFYKVGKEDTYALSGKSEWIESGDIIMRQVIASRALTNYKGFSVFRYESMFGEEEQKTQSVLKETEKLTNIILQPSKSR